ncbi:MAG: hypothetical protein ACP5NZ_01860 [Nanobdellota archaeon]
MNKLFFIFAFFVIVLYSLPLITPNFACGLVKDSENISSSWREVIIYPEKNTSSFITCQINPENKFCCDLEEIKGLSVGERVFAEVFDKESGFVSNRRDLIITEEGYDLFPEMIIQKAISISSPSERIFINKSSVLINIFLAENYNNLNYSLNSSKGYFEEHFCEKCTNILLPISLAKGKNEIIITAYGDREISEKIIFYNLDYLNFSRKVICNKCELRDTYFYVPSEQNITFLSSFNSSHNISGDFLFYFPSEWSLLSSSGKQDFSPTHNILKSKIEDKRDFSINYSLTSPKVFIKTDYLFYQKIENQELITKLRVFKSKLIPFHKKNIFSTGYFIKTSQEKASPTEPVVLNPNGGFIQLLAIFPNKEVIESYSNIKFDVKDSGKSIESYFTILTSIPDQDIEKIWVIFKVEKEKEIQVYLMDKEISLEFYREDANYAYYSAWLYEKGPFKIIIL